MSIVSKRHPIKFYFLLICITAIFFALATAMLFTYKQDGEKRQRKPKEMLMPIFSAGCYFFAGYTIYRYIRNAPAILLDKDAISFNGQRFLLSDIETMELTGKQIFRYAINMPMEAAVLKFKNGTSKYIFDEVYSNSWEIKSFLQQIVIDQKDRLSNECHAIDKNHADNDLYETFKGNQLISARGLLLWGQIGFIIYMLITSEKPADIKTLLSFSAFSIFWFLIFSWQMHYFQVSDNYFLVRNHNFFWKKEAYNIIDIKEVVFETRGKMPNCLRLITKDFKSKFYQAGTLSNRTWLNLKDKLETYNIKVRNECI